MKNNTLSGNNIIHKKTFLKDIINYYHSKELPLSLDFNNITYEVFIHQSSKEQKEGDLLLGISNINPGTVNEEFFMTKGHFHVDQSKAEYYWGISGQGLLLLMDQNRNYSIQEVMPGSIHYISGNLAHRLVNTGNEILSVGACWHPTSGYDYDTIVQQGFPIRIFKEGNSYKIITI